MAKKKTLIFLGALLFISVLVNATNTPDTVRFGLYIKTLNIGTSEEFYCDFYWWLKIPSTIGKDQLDDFKNFEIVNARRNIELTTLLEQFIKNDKDPTKSHYYVYGTCKGDFIYKPNFEDYPIDRQTLSLKFESSLLEKHKLIYVFDSLSYYENGSSKLGIEPEGDLPNCTVESLKFKPETKYYNTDFGDITINMPAEYSRMALDINVKRDELSYILKILVPCFILLIIAYLVFYISADKLDVAASCTVTSLLACIALQLITADDLPSIGYLTISDNLFYFFYTLISGALIQTVISYNLELQNKYQISHLLELLGRWAYPVISVTGVVLILNKKNFAALCLCTLEGLIIYFIIFYLNGNKKSRSRLP